MPYSAVTDCSPCRIYERFYMCCVFTEKTHTGNVTGFAQQRCLLLFFLWSELARMPSYVFVPLTVLSPTVTYIQEHMEKKGMWASVKVSGQSRWKGSKLSSLLALFQVLIALFLHALRVCVSDEMGAHSHRAETILPSSLCLSDASLPAGAFIALWLTGQQLKTDTFISIRAD